jgi:hypothetical protein
MQVSILFCLLLSGEAAAGIGNGELAPIAPVRHLAHMQRECMSPLLADIVAEAGD